MADRYEHQTPGPMRWWLDISAALGRRASQVFVQVVDILDREARQLGCISLCSPLYISGTATAFSTGLTGDDVVEGYNYSLTVYQ